MSSMAVWSLGMISYQTIFCIAISWLVLGCKIPPNPDELHEVTLMKFLYLHDPKSCGRVYFYNVTNKNEDRFLTNVAWSLANEIASAFRVKMQIWLCLHLFWLAFAIIHFTQGERSFSFYSTLLPFTVTGVALLLVDVAFATIFFIDAYYTATESAILDYVDKRGGFLRAMHYRPLATRLVNPEDTSWISILMAYISLRGIVQWIINFWIIKDNFTEGRHQYLIRMEFEHPKKSASNDSHHEEY
ncbi:uncharacterized protein LOC142976268 [Anticarsia gemmatalis]|uniref:uncharacterized protein LOC142976268 n=1 Tax=Anticarsia gemmatalis TaxID=129554 RepID=UPI003F75A258